LPGNSCLGMAGKVLFLIDFILMFVIAAMLRENSFRYRRETYRIDGQWLSDDAVKFARWQHRAMGYRARFVVIIYSCLFITELCGA